MKNSKNTNEFSCHMFNIREKNQRLNDNKTEVRFFFPMYA